MARTKKMLSPETNKPMDVEMEYKDRHPFYSILRPAVTPKATQLCQYLSIPEWLAILFVFVHDQWEINMQLPTYYDLPFGMRMFWDEYGPFIVDFFLALPLVRLARRWQTSTFNRGIIERVQHTSLLDLPDELILEICRQIKISYCQYGGGGEGRCKGCISSRQTMREFSKVNKQIRQLIAPQIFDTVRISYGWRRAQRGLQTVQNSVHAYHCTKEVRMSLYIGSGKGPGPPRMLPKHLAMTLQGLPTLAKLALVIPEHHTQLFKTVLNNRAVSLPGVRSLMLGPLMDWVIPLCPNVESVSSNDWPWLHSNVDSDYNSRRHTFDLIRSAALAPKLQHFEMYEYWERRYLWAIRKSIPSIQSLAMPGGRYKDGIKKLLPALSRFSNLRTLALAEAFSLHVGFNPPGCGNAYFGPHGDEVRARVAEEGRQARQRIAEMVFKKLKGLEVLWVGDGSKATVERTVSSDIGEISWSYEWRDGASDRYRRR